MGSLTDFVSTFQRGFVHPNLFEVTFPRLPTALSKYANILRVACKAANIPGTTFTEAQFMHDGYNEKFVSGIDYDPITLTFLVDGGNETKKDSEIIKVFDEWGALIFSDGKFGFKNDYACDIKYKIFNRDGSELYTTTIIDAYPINITAFDLSSESRFNIMEYNISFNFLKFV